MKKRIVKGKHHKIDYSRFVKVFILTLAVFLIGIFVGNYFTELKMDSLSNAEETLRLEIIGLDMQNSILSAQPCHIFNDNVLAESINELGSKVSHLENSVSPTNKQLINLKTYYSLLQLRHWALSKNAKPRCNSSKDLVIYFYSNNNDCDLCKEQGIILSNIRTNSDDLFIYSIDSNLDNPALNTLKEIYKVHSTFPVIIINEKRFEGFLSKNEILDELSGA